MFLSTKGVSPRLTPSINTVEPGVVVMSKPDGGFTKRSFGVQPPSNNAEIKTRKIFFIELY